MNEKFKNLWETKTKNDEWWSSFVTAPLGIVLNYIAVEYKCITPNRITLASFLVAITAAICVVAGGSWNFVIGAILIHFSHVLDCMDGQIARYRKVSSSVGSYFDRLTDQIQVIIWFGAAGYSASVQSGNAMPIYLSFIGVTFYSLRGYAKYVAIEIETANDPSFPTKMAQVTNQPATAGLGFSAKENLIWFAREQPKILAFNEGVFIFMLSAGLVLDALTPMLWIFALSQLAHGLFRPLQHGCQISKNSKSPVRK
ncbi:CDP-alcohol phosphatidyltransferase family protein [Halocynthiibacter styelae]|uniref:CDP-alcohol phosphatidyltransferase family protein n=1 Tax=Halocynthiibacter styelae TaxID=2761955 RepID=A0A8J7IL88_9RHOB|nr:CDP-alcohol phosphatidyltransferase family protein [Paenihalocynthiibacter styelae]MBI1495458.1 CDP-alcohol phosphatidyltransferase family protein [Paenihalocynthiibacter styelae]